MLEPPTSHPVLVSGPGRAGTSLLMKWFQAAGVPTGGAAEHWVPQARAGMEMRLDPDRPMPPVVKDPWAHEYLEPILADGYRIAGLIVPLRDLRAAAASRVLQTRADLASSAADLAGWQTTCHVSGGIIYSLSEADQEAVLARGLYRLLDIASRYEIPVALPHYPELAMDFDHLWRAVSGQVGHLMDRASGLAAFQAVADPGQTRVRDGCDADGSAAGGSHVRGPDRSPLARELGRRMAERDREHRAEVQRLQAELQHERDRAAQLGVRADGTEARLQAVSAQAAAMETGLHAALRTSQEEAGEREAALERVMRSRSWRLTAPLRRAAERARRDQART